MFAVKFCFIQHHDDFIPKTNSCSKITRFICEQEIGFLDQEYFGFDLVEQARDGKRQKVGLVAALCHTMIGSAFSSVLVWTVEYATKTVVWTRIDRCVFGLMKTHTFENALVWTGPKTAG